MSATAGRPEAGLLARALAGGGVDSGLRTSRPTRRILANTGWLLGAQVVSGLSQFVRSALIARYLGPLVYGHWGFAFAFVNLFAAAADFGLSTLAVKDLARGTSVGRYAGTVTVIKLVLNLTLVVVIAGLALVVTSSSQTRHLIYLMSAQMLLSSLTLLVHSAFRARERMEIESVINAVLALLTLVSIGMLVAAGSSAEELAGAFVVMTALGLIASIAILLTGFVPSRVTFDASLALSLMRQTWPIGLAMVTTSLYYFFDRVCMGALGQDVQVGWYTAAYAPTLWLAGIVSMVRTAFLPGQSRAFAGESDLHALHAFYWRVSLGLAVPAAVGGALVASPLLESVYGVAYLPGALALRLLSVAAGCMFISSFFGSQLLASGRQRTYLGVVMVGAAVNMALNVLLIPAWSLNGAAVATLAAEAAVALTAWSRVRSNWRPRELFRAGYAPLTAAGAMAASLILLAPLLGVWVAMPAATGVYLLAGTRLGILRQKA